MKTHPPPKNCLVCGREVTWRKKWERTWSEVKYYGEKCRRFKGTLDGVHEERILALLAELAHHSSICPSDALSEPSKDPSEFRGPIRLKLKR